MQSQQPHRPLRGGGAEGERGLGIQEGPRFLENLAYFWAGSQKADAGALVGFETENQGGDLADLTAQDPDDQRSGSVTCDAGSRLR